MNGFSRAIRGSKRFSRMLWIVVSFLVPGLARASGTITEFPLPAGSYPWGMTAGPDGNVWFCEYGSSKIARITPGGAITEFDVGLPPIDIAAGSDGNIWFAASDLDFGSGSEIGRIWPTSGAVNEFFVADACSIAAGPDGNMWFGGCASDVVGRISPGADEVDITSFHLAAGRWAYDITAGPDGNLWFTEPVDIGRMTTTGSLMEFPLPAGSNPLSITPGPDGNLWFTDGLGGTINRITTAGVVTEFGLAATVLGRGPDGNLWIGNGNVISRLLISEDGVDAGESYPTSAGVFAIAAGADGNLWFTESSDDKVGFVDLACPTGSLCLGNRFAITADWNTGASAGTGTPVSITANAGYFWFSSPSNVEVFVKILDNCRGSGKFNVYVNGLTHLGVTVTVTDTRTGASKQFVNPDGAPFSLLFDGSTFACP